MSEATKKFIEENNIDFVLAQFVDIHGVAKTKAVPADFIMDVVNEGAGFAGFAVWGLNMEPHSPDFLARGDLNTLSVVPWQPGFARIVCEGYVNGEPYIYDSRITLKRQLEKLSARGWTMHSGLEPEFSLFKRNENGDLTVADETDKLDKPCYDYKGLSRSREFIQRFVKALQEVDYEVYQIDHEDANGQFEVNYTYSDALTSADRFTFLRMAAGEIANDLGLVCSFMPKPSSDRTGNGMHYHLSIEDENGVQLFSDDEDENNLGLSATAYHFLGGLMAHAKALCAIAAPTVNSYKRLVVGGALSGATWAPAYICYGDNNRSSMVRIPYGRLEYRLADAGCNPYLVHAAIIAAGLDGIERKLDPGKPLNENLYNLSPADLEERNIGMLPQTLGEALDELEADEIFCKALGEEIVSEFIKVKRMEWIEYCRHVSDWEKERYSEYF